MKKILQTALIILFALVLSVLSMFIKTGTDITEAETVGNISKWGFPISYRITAPGLAWAKFDGVRFWLNSATWLAVLVSIRIITALRRRLK